MDFSNLDLSTALLQGARLEGTNLIQAKIDSDTNFTSADVRYAAVKSGDYGHAKLNQDQVNSMFGDASVILPDGINRPDHWPPEDLVDHEFYSLWLAWQKD